MGDPAVQVLVQLDKTQAEKDAKAFSVSTADALSGVKAALDLAATGFRFLADAVVSVIGPAQEAERAQRALTSALRQQTADYAAHVTRLGAYNAALQESVNIDDDALAALQAKLSLLGVLPSELEAATRATIGLAEITGQDLASAGTQVSKVLAGNVEALGKLGLKGTDIADVLRKLDRGFISAQDRAQTFEGRVHALTVSWEALKEEIGTAIITNPEVLGGLEDLRRWVKEITTAAENGRSPLGAFISDVVRGLREVAEFARNRAGDLDRIKTTFEILGRTTVGGGMIRTGSKIVGWVGDRIEEANAAAAIRGGGAESGLRGSAGGAGGGVASILASAAGTNASDFGLGDIAFGVGEGATVRGNKNAAKQWEAARREAEARDEWTRDRQARTLEDMARYREQERDAMIDGLRLKREGFEAEQAIAEQRRSAEFDNNARRWEIQQAQLDADRRFNDEMIGIGVGGISGFIDGTVSALIQGKADIGSLLGSLFGGMLAVVGQSMVALGTSALIAASASSAIPFLWPIFGGPIGVGGAIALIGAGSVLTGVGHGLSAVTSGASKTASSAVSAARSTSARSTSTSAPSGFVPSQSGATNVTNINVNFGPGFMTGSPRQIARSIRDVLREGGTMLPAGT